MLIPRCTYTDPEVASVGATERELKSGSVAYDVYARDLIENDRAICEDKSGLYRVFTKKGTDTILGASLVGGPAGDLIGLVSTAMTNKIGLKNLGNAIYPYPTYAEIFRQMGDAYNKTQYGPKTKMLLRTLLRMRK